MKIVERLGTLKKLNGKAEWVNRDLFRMVCCPDFAVLAYERLKSKPGNLTAGDDGLTLDSISRDKLDRLCGAIKCGSYKPNAVRTRRILKADGRQRLLGIPAPRDKIVHEMVREILESIYDSPEGPTFTSQSHGFRPNRSCHTAIRDFTSWHGVVWLIEGDIEGFFDAIDHHVLVNLLRQRIQDERFINLIWKILRAGIRDESGRWLPSTLGAPQGATLSPIFANVYLHEFDSWMVALQRRHIRGKKRAANPQWRSLRRRRERRIATGKLSVASDEIKEMDRQLGNMPTVLTDDPKFCRVWYIRYADNWIVGVIGPRALACEIKSEAQSFLAERLKLTLSEPKTRITHMKTGEANFLNFRLKVGSSVKRRLVKTVGKRTVLKRVTGWSPLVHPPVLKLVQRLQQAGFCRTRKGSIGFPRSKKSLVALEDHDIIMRFNAIFRGIYNYYRVCDGAARLRWLLYILQYSCLMTLAHKHRISLKRSVARYGTFPKKDYTIASGEKRIAIFAQPETWQKKAALSPRPLHLDELLAKIAGRLTRSHLNSPCAICENVTHIEMHHVRALRRGQRTITKGFDRILSAINRKQVPLCVSCHSAVHKGAYDGIRLGALAYAPQ